MSSKAILKLVEHKYFADDKMFSKLCKRFREWFLETFGMVIGKVDCTKGPFKNCVARDSGRERVCVRVRVCACVFSKRERKRGERSELYKVCVISTILSILV